MTTRFRAGSPPWTARCHPDSAYVTGHQRARPACCSRSPWPSAPWGRRPQLAFGASLARDGADSLRWGVDASAHHRGAVVRAEYVTRHRDGRARARDDFGWYVFESVRVAPRWQVMARQEDFQRPWYGPARRSRGLAWGASWDVVPARVKLLGELSRRMTGRAQQHTDVWLAQVQARF